MKKQVGIVLKNYRPQSERYAILDSDRGRIDAQIGVSYKQSQQFSPGSILVYRTVDRGDRVRLTEVEVHKVPLRFARKDIYFLHHILELSYHFLPYNQTVPQSFDLVLFLINSFAQISTAQEKKFFLLRFFSILGIYPEDDPFEQEYLRLISLPFGSMFKEVLTKKVDQSMERWLARCIAMHPYNGQFKTIFFSNSSSGEYET